MPKLSDVAVPFLGQDLSPVSSGLTIDSNVISNDHIASLSSSLSSALCQVNRIRHLFSKDVFAIFGFKMSKKPFAPFPPTDAKFRLVTETKQLSQ